MLVISQETLDALQRDLAPRAEQRFRTDLIAADRALFGTLAPDALDAVIRDARQRAEAVGMPSIGAAAIFATLLVASRGDPDAVAGFAPVLAVLRDIEVPGEVRLQRAAAMLSDPDEDLPRHQRPRPH